MPLFADIDAAGWGVIIGAISIGIGGVATGVANIIIGYKDRKRAAEEKIAERKEVQAREDAKIERDRLAAEKVEQVSKKADVAAVKVEEVKATLETSTVKTDTKLDNIGRTGDAVHVLVNSQYSAQLQVASLALRRVADLTKHPDDIKAAALAEKLLREHEEKQAVADSAGAVSVAIQSITPDAVKKIADEVVGRTVGGDADKGTTGRT